MSEDAPRGAQAAPATAERPSGTLFYIVGPSGVGKDSLIDTLRGRLGSQRFVFARRVITRPADSVGEQHDACSESQFAERQARGGFLLDWQAHGLRYGLPIELAEDLAAGRHVIANGSRAQVGELARRTRRLVIIEIEAPTELIAGRLAARGRESADDIAKRLARERAIYPDTVKVVRVSNDSDLQTGSIRLLNAILAQIDPATAEDPAIPDEPCDSHRALLRKLAGERLAQNDWNSVLAAIVDGRVEPSARDALLLACANDLDDDELACVARWRSQLMPRVDWGRQPVVDKHSLGGTAGSRVTMVVVPIVAAHGMLIPKTSSRAITSAAGTADAMEVLARVDLDPAQLRAAVARAGACIAWNGRLNHSVLDEAMHRLERLLALDTRRWSVASILSKKWSAGATHVVVDVPYMPAGKVASRADADAVAALFEQLGARLGMTVRAFPSDGSAPIGRGIGPALEARDVLQVLECQPDAPADLRAKSLLFAARILSLDPALGDLRAGEQRALELLESGAARRAMQSIIEAQGIQPAPDPTDLRSQTCATSAGGTVLSIDARRISTIARLAGAPTDPLAGVDLACSRGDRLPAGAVLYRVQTRDEARLAKAFEAAVRDPGIRLE